MHSRMKRIEECLVGLVDIGKDIDTCEFDTTANMCYRWCVLDWSDKG